MTIALRSTFLLLVALSLASGARSEETKGKSLNDEDVRYLQKDATAVNDSDSISIVPSIAGGRN